MPIKDVALSKAPVPLGTRAGEPWAGCARQALHRTSQGDLYILWPWRRHELRGAQLHHADATSLQGGRHKTDSVHELILARTTDKAHMEPFEQSGLSLR